MQIVSLEIAIVQIHIPQHEIETLARCILPDILKYYENEEGQREFEKQKQGQKQKNTT